MNLADILVDVGRLAPGSPALEDESGKVTYATLQSDSEGFRRALEAAGVQRGDVLVFDLPNSVVLVTGYFAAWAMGCVVAPVRLSETLHTPSAILELLRPKLVICEAHDRWEQNRGACAVVTPVELVASSLAVGTAQLNVAATEPGEAALIVLTSGTSGVAKGVMLSHDSLLENARAKARALMLDEHVRALCPVSLAHAYGINALVNPVLSKGGCVVLTRTFRRNIVVGTLRVKECTHFFGVPSIFAAFMDWDVPASGLPALRFALSGGAPLSPALQRRWRERYGFPLAQAYGMSEAGPCVTVTTGATIGACGTPVEGVEIRIRPADENLAVADGGIGEIEVRSPYVMLGYVGGGSGSVSPFDGVWLRTGDVGRIEADGSLSVLGRLRDIIIVNGLNVFPDSLERVLRGMPCVSDAAVYGYDRDDREEGVGALVVLKPGSSEADFRKVCAASLPRHCVPTRVVTVTAIPRSASGKVMRGKVAEIASKHLKKG